MSNISGVAALLLWKAKYVEWEAAHACTLAHSHKVTVADVKSQNVVDFMFYPLCV